MGAEAAEILALSALLMLLSIGIVRGWRWLFWLIMIALTYRACGKLSGADRFHLQASTLETVHV